MSLPTISRAFGELFGAAKDKLNRIQKSMASLLPSIPGMPVGKFYDLAIGVDIHVTTAPPLPVCPVPHIGMVYDLMATIMSAVASHIPPPPPPPEGGAASMGLADVALGLVKGMAPSVKVHNQWIANAGIPIVHLPAFVLHVTPVVAPMSESEMWMGSSTVLADGSPCSTQFHPALSCNTVGFPSPPRKKGLFKKPKKSLMAPTSLLSIITSGGKPVLVGEPPTIDLFQTMVKVGMKGLMKMWSKTKLAAKLDKMIADSPLGKIQKKANCFLFGEPVSAATGRVFHENVDFELPGPVPFIWKRTYYSDAEVDGPLGYNWHHSYNMGICEKEDYYVLRLPEGREAAFPKLTAGESYFNRKEKLLWKYENHAYVIEDTSGLLYHFGSKKNRQGYEMLTEISTKDGFSIRFRYDHRGDLEQITDSRNQTISVRTDLAGRILCLSVKGGGEEEDNISLVRYRYDKSGNMVETMDANDASKHFEYDGHLLVKLTSQSGLSFNWEYKGKGDNARCVHTWGDNGVLEYLIEYFDGMTRATNGMGHATEYYYDERKLIYKIIDANGGITHQIYNAEEELEVVVDPEGLPEKRRYDDRGNVVSFTNANEETTNYAYDKENRLTGINTPAGRSQDFKYDSLGRMVSRTNSSGQTFTYRYEGALLKTIIDSQKRNYGLEYNRFNDLEKLTYPNGLFRQWKYDSQGRLLTSRDVKGNYTRYHYDRKGNLIHLEEADGNVHDFKYDASGNMIHAKDNLHEVAFTYGVMGILKSRTQNGRSVQFGYNYELQLRRIINEKNERYYFEYDPNGQVIKEIGFDDMEREYVRDGAGRVTKVIRPGGHWTQYLYDGTGNVVKEEHHDETWTAYRYDADGLLVEALNENGLIQIKRDRAGRIVEETQGEHSVQRKYDRLGDCIQISSSLGADIRQQFDEDGNLIQLQSGESWQADWRRDETGLELHRQLTGGVSVRTERDGFGRETRKSVGVRNIEQSGKQYQWGVGNRLHGIYDERTGKHTNFDYDAFDNLIKADYHENNSVETIYRTPDAIGNLFERKDRTDRKYDAGGRLKEDLNHNYYYDCEGNLIFKEFKKPQGFKPWGKEAIEKKYGIKMTATGTGWYYRWLANGMLMRVVNPQQGIINFGYDPLGRRVWKEAKQKRTCWLWDGNVPLHEWQTTEKEPLIDVITWVFEEGTFVPTARITNKGSESIVTDYLGTPTQMFDANGEKTWEAHLDIYGRVRTFAGRSLNECPFRYQGQYQDEETGLYYNRFRYYSPEEGMYISQDPIRLNGGNPTLYGYVYNPNVEIDQLGLKNNIRTGAGRTHVTYQGVKNGLPYTGYASAPSALNLEPDEIIAYRYSGNFDDFGGIPPQHVYIGEGVKGKRTARGLEQRLYEADVKAAGRDKIKVANRQNPIGENNPNRKKYLAAADNHLKGCG